MPDRLDRETASDRERDDEQLAVALRDAVASRLEPSGWRYVDEDGWSDATVRAFAQRLDDQFAATAEIVVERDRGFDCPK